MHLFCLLGDGWAWAIQVAESVGCAPGELQGEGCSAETLDLAQACQPQMGLYCLDGALLGRCST